MSDSEHSTVTYTSVSEDDSDIGSPGVEGPPIMPEDPYAYIMAAYGVPPSPDFKYMARAEEQPLHAAASPTAESPGYIPESDPEEDPADYPADRDDDDLRRRRRELDYDITDTWDDPVGAIDEIAPTTVEGVNLRVTDLATIIDEETTSMYGIMEDAQDDRSQLRGRVNLLYRDRPVHHYLAMMVEREAKMALVAQSALILELQSADHRRQRAITELLASDHRRQVQLTETLRLLKGLQTQMVEFQRQHGPAKGPAQPDAPGEASSSS
ncbi:hypothetical protein Tco_0554177 [Tanacetum coccineum]